MRSGSQRGGVELAAPPGSDWCGDKKRSQGGEKGTLSSGESTACHRNCEGGNMSGLPSEPLRKGGPMCPYFPYCESPHGALQCVRLALLIKEHREAIDIDRKVCLQCCEQEVDADGTCGRCRSTRAPASEPSPPAGAMAETRLDCSSRGGNRPGLLRVHRTVRSGQIQSRAHQGSSQGDFHPV
jgi:hypothetical protein